MSKLTDGSTKLFLELLQDAGNWSGSPLVECTPEERGHLTDLKKHKLLTTHIDEGCTWASFTEKGLALAYELDSEAAADLESYL